MKALVVDYEMGNLGSVRRSFEECGAEVLVSSNPKDLKLATHIVLPGVGAFAEGMEHLIRGGWVEPLRRAVLSDRIPTLGICLGMQLFADRGFEKGDTRGLGLIAGKVALLEPGNTHCRIPHIGWNEVDVTPHTPLFSDIPNKSDFYFVHSFQFIPERTESIIGRTPYCDTFVSAIQSDNAFGVQFHPEKSSRAGLKLIHSFLEYRPHV